MVGGQYNREIQTPPDHGSEGVSARRTDLLLRGVLGRNSLVPVILRGLLVRGPHVRPESGGLGSGTATLDDDAEGFLRNGEWASGHGIDPLLGEAVGVLSWR